MPLEPVHLTAQPLEPTQIYEAGTISNLTYLFLSFPLGLSYFIALIIGLALGFPLTLVFGAGIPFLIMTLWLSLQGAALERWLNDAMLGIPVPFTIRTSSPKRLRDRMMASLRDPYAWRTILYLLLKFPFGLISLVLMVGLLGVALALMYFPIGFLTYGVSRDLSIEFGPISLQIDTLRNAIFAGVAGLIIAAISFPILNLMAHWWGRFARLMLSNDTDLEPISEPERSLKTRPEQS